MILSKLYNEIMQKIEVTDEMRSRILNNISAQPVKQSNKIIRFINPKKIMSVAACVVLLVVCGTLVNNIFHSGVGNQEDIVSNPFAEAIECKSANELSQRAGFTVKDVEYIPFEIESTSYRWCGDELAEIEYVGSDNTLLYRKSVGTDDISGDYTDYEQSINENVNGRNVTIKGDKDSCFLAVWQCNGYSFSINVSQGVDYDSMLKMIESIE